ncbi:hypothetical protein BsWGS_28883 [Bradybaena similaris]
MESHSLLPSNNIKLEPACEADNVQTKTRENISEAQVFDKMDSKIPASVKMEKPEVYIDYPGDDMKIQTCSQSCLTLQEKAEKEKKVFSIDWKLVKQEPSDVLCENESHSSAKMVGIADCCIIQEMAGHNKTESQMLEDTAVVHHQEVSLIGTEKYFTASEPFKNWSPMSESVSSTSEINTNLCLTNENCQLHNVETPAQYTQISGTALDYVVGRIHTGGKLYKCDMCAVSYTRAYHLKCHLRTHIGEKPYKCDVCVTQGDDLKCHMRTHTGEKPYKCDICGASFMETSNLKRHMRTHSREKPYKCGICLASFTQCGHLKHHMRTHAGEKPHKCDNCGASFNVTGNLKRHMRTHTGEKPYKCDVCGKFFTQGGDLNCHMRTHIGEKLFKCDVCGESFNRTDNLKHHMRTHTGEKPYKCDMCGASFNGTGILKRHMRTHTGECFEDLSDEDPFISNMEQNIKFFQEHLKFYQKLLDIYKKEGKEAAALYKRKHKKLPKRPKATSPVSGKKKTITSLKGNELLAALKHLLGDSTERSEVTPFNEEEKDVDEIKSIIIRGEKAIHARHRQVLKDAVILGRWLDKLAKLYYNSFNTFVKENIKLGPRWVRRLRSVTRVFCKYTKLQNLNITLSVAAQIASSVETAIDNLDRQERQFWII